MREWERNFFHNVLSATNLDPVSHDGIIHSLLKIFHFTEEMSPNQSVIIAYSSGLRSLGKWKWGRLDSDIMTSLTHTQRQIIMTLVLFDSERQTHVSYPGKINRRSALSFQRKLSNDV